MFVFVSIYAYDLYLNLKQVLVRIRPTGNIGIGDETVKKVSSDTLCVGDRQFQFDSIFDTNTSQVKYFTSLLAIYVLVS